MADIEYLAHSRKQQENASISFETQYVFSLHSDPCHKIPPSAPIDEQFATIVTQLPDAVAVFCDEICLTYQFLDQRANQLAHFLLTCGAGLEVPVGVCLPRSPELLLALLALTKIGATYVPMEPSFPAAHLRMIVEDTAMPVLITLEAYRPLFPPQTVTLVSLDLHTVVLAQQPLDRPPHQSTVETLLYMIYTSGSTGRPKGVAVEQRQLINLLDWIRRVYPTTPGEIAAQRTTIASTISGWESFGAGLTGMPFVIIPDLVVKDIPRFMEMLALYHVSRITLVPSLLRLFVKEKPELVASLAGLKLWFIAGEILTNDLVQDFYTQFPHARLLNSYGASEVNTVMYFDTYGQTFSQAYVPLGLPLDMIEIYLLDTHLQQVPSGVPGEICIGSPSLARGYFNRPELTAEKFIPHPFSSVAGARLYRTGDLGRRLPDGQLICIGRRDFQVKIRGLRVELEGIETVLKQHPAVNQAAVIVHQDEKRHQQMIAYVVLHRQAELSISDLYNFLKTKVPEYMIPTLFEKLDVLPLTSNGKINRMALPIPTAKRSQAEVPYVEAQTLIENIVVAIWIEVLGVDQVSIHDNFFMLGGHSLIITQIISRIRNVFQIEIPISYVFEEPTIYKFAQRLEGLLHSQGDLSIMQMVDKLSEEEINEALDKFL